MLISASNLREVPGLSSARLTSAEILIAGQAAYNLGHLEVAVGEHMEILFLPEGTSQLLIRMHSVGLVEFGTQTYLGIDLHRGRRLLPGFTCQLD